MELYLIEVDLEDDWQAEAFELEFLEIELLLANHAEFNRQYPEGG